MFLLWSYEKAVDVHNYRLFWKGLCFILFQLYGSKAGLFKGTLFWVVEYDSFSPSYWKKNYSNINIT